MESNRRYMPQIRVPEIGKEGQELLQRKRVLIIGCGALGSVTAMYLAGAGVRTLIIADFDTVDESNLHRQVFFGEEEAGRRKVELLKERIEKLNSNVKVEIEKRLVTRKVLEEMAEEIDLIVDAADNPDTTFMIDRFCRENEISWTTAGVRGWEAQIFSYRPGSIPYSEIISQEDLEGEVMPCSVEGILGPVAGIAACIQCAEVIKLLLEVGQPLVDRLLTINLLDDTFLRLELGDEDEAGNGH